MLWRKKYYLKKTHDQNTRNKLLVISYHSAEKLVTEVGVKRIPLYWMFKFHLKILPDIMWKFLEVSIIHDQMRFSWSQNFTNEGTVLTFVLTVLN